MPDFNDWGGLVSAVESKVPKILTDYVSKEMELLLQRKITDNVYGAYTPIENGWVLNGKKTTYQRRYSLQSIANMTEDMEDPWTIYVTSTAEPITPIRKGYSFDSSEDGAFLKLFDVGNMGIWTHRHGVMPRKVIEETEIAFESSGDIARCIENGIHEEIER